MRSLRCVCVIAVMVCVLTQSLVLAQPGRGRRGQLVIDRAVALGFQQVRDELKIGAEQLEKIEAALAEHQKKVEAARPDRSAFEFLSSEEEQELREQVRKDMQEASQQGNDALSALLEEGQIQRLDEMILQAQLRFTPVNTLRKRFEFTDAQQEQLKQVEQHAADRQTEMRSEIMKKFQANRANINFDEIREMASKLQKEVEQLALAVLTEEQQSQLVAMQGEPFEFDLRNLMGRGRRGGGRSGRPGRQRPQPSESEQQ